MTRVCPDGVETFDQVTPGGMVPTIRYRSNRRQLFELELARLEDSIVCQFINAHTPERLAHFLGKFGLLNPNFQPRQEIEAEQWMLRGFLKRAGSGDAAKAKVTANALGASFSYAVRPRVESSGRKRRPLRPVLVVGDLQSFMRLEIVLAAANGARFANCRYCGDVFLTGKATAGRSTAKYCRTLCRVRAHRDKSKRKEGRHVGQKA
jgi:hypothetical protein